MRAETEWCGQMAFKNLHPVARSHTAAVLSEGAGTLLADRIAGGVRLREL